MQPGFEAPIGQELVAQQVLPFPRTVPPPASPNAGGAAATASPPQPQTPCPPGAPLRPNASLPPPDPLPGVRGTPARSPPPQETARIEAAGKRAGHQQTCWTSVPPHSRLFAVQTSAGRQHHTQGITRGQQKGTWGARGVFHALRPASLSSWNENTRTLAGPFRGRPSQGPPAAAPSCPLLPCSSERLLAPPPCPLPPRPPTGPSSPSLRRRRSALAPSPRAPPPPPSLMVPPGGARLFLP